MHTQQIKHLKYGDAPKGAAIKDSNTLVLNDQDNAHYIPAIALEDAFKVHHAFVTMRSALRSTGLGIELTLKVNGTVPHGPSYDFLREISGAEATKLYQVEFEAALFKFMASEESTT